MGDPPQAVQGDPTKKASPEEREYWKKQHKYVESVVAECSDVDEVKEAMAGTELFTFPSTDGSYQIESRFFPAKGVKNPPLMIHFHGGGMTTLTRDTGYEMMTCHRVSQMGCSVLTPEFRNAREFPFPKGVDDCLETIKWAHANKDLLGFSGTVITTGCSGGGNLSIATFVRALEKGLDAPNLIHGIFADAPCIRPQYTGVPRIEAVEVSPLTPANVLDDLCFNYTESEDDAKNPSAWPLLAPDEMIRQFPPTMMRGEEFDTLHEDAKEFYERLSSLNIAGCSYSEYANLIHCQWAMGKEFGISEIQLAAVLGEVVGFAQALDFIRTEKISEKEIPAVAGKAAEDVAKPVDQIPA